MLVNIKSILFSQSLQHFSTKALNIRYCNNRCTTMQGKSYNYSKTWLQRIQINGNLLITNPVWFLYIARQKHLYRYIKIFFFRRTEIRYLMSIYRKRTNENKYAIFTFNIKHIQMKICFTWSKKMKNKKQII